ncbi:MAG: T9SS type A sorting domain-containing protein [Bacteroidales bacterium]|nr:T9SS type A sorting domain-containing protein [Bacteroidales bacterium]
MKLRYFSIFVFLNIMFFSNLKGQQIAANSNGHVYFASDDGVYRTKDYGRNWNKVVDLAAINAISVNAENSVFLGHGGLGVYLLTNNDNSLKQIKQDLTVFSMHINEKGHIFVGDLHNGIYFSKDGGNSWDNYSSFVSGVQSVCYAIESKNNGYLFAGIGWGFFGTGVVFRSKNNGDSWSGLYGDLPDLDVFTCFCCDNKGQIFTGSFDFTGFGGIFRSGDNGDSWTKVNNGLKETSIRCISVNSKNTLFAGTYGGGMYRSKNDGGQWEEVNKGLSDLRVSSMVICPNGYLFIKTSGDDRSKVFLSKNEGSDWERVFLSTTAVENKLSVLNNLPSQDFVLNQNYPNPFNGTTKITYRLFKPDYVNLKVFNIAGQEIDNLIDQNQLPGQYEILWIPKNIPSGVYLCKLQVGHNMEMKKIVFQE